MRTNFYNVKTIAAIYVAVLLILPTLALAQTPPTGLDCDPLPEDPDLLEQCVFYQGIDPNNGYVDNTSSTINGPGQGTWGTASAYNPNTKQVLIVTSMNDGSSIRAQLFDEATMTAVNKYQVVDQSSRFVGNPEAVYNPITDNYFVVWNDERANLGIYGRFIAPDGTPLGNDFSISRAGWPGIDLAVDKVNQKYVIIYDVKCGDGYACPEMITMDFSGTPGQPLTLNRLPGDYEGQSSLTYNSATNEYLYAFVATLSGSDSAQEDDRIYVGRVNADTLQPVGELVQVSDTRIGRNAFASPSLKYSATDGATLIAWQEMGKTPGVGSEIYGRTMYNDFTVSNIYPILTLSTYPVSNFYGSPRNMVYNEYTNTYAIATEDNNGATTYIEFTSGGSILDVTETIPPLGSNGNFMPGVGITSGGFVTWTTPNYSQLVLNPVPSVFVNYPPATPPTPWPTPNTNFDTSSLAKTISKVYIWSLAIAGMIAIGMAVVGGYFIMTSRGNAAQAGKGKEYITSAIVGLIILFGSFIILNTINSDLTDFTVPSLDLLNKK